MRVQLTAILITFGILFPCYQEEGTLPAGEDPAERNTSEDYLRIQFNFYDQNDGGGNPNLDESMTILEPMVLFQSRVSEKWTINAMFMSDIISAASVKSGEGKRFPSGVQSGASGDKYFALNIGAFYAWSDQVSVGGGISGAKEYEYSSLGAFLSTQYESADKNDTVTFKLSGYFDSLDLILFDGTEENSDSRQTAGVGLGWTHILGPETYMELNYDLTIQTGFLSTSYNSVVAAGSEVREILPDNRFRNALYGSLRHLVFDDLAIEPGAGFYLDDWGATAFHLNLTLFWEMVPGTVILEPHYRFHWQSEVDYFVSPQVSLIPEFRTQDPDLDQFSSHTLGLKTIFPDVPLMEKNTEIEIGFDYTIRSNNLDSFSVTFGFQWNF